MDAGRFNKAVRIVHAHLQLSQRRETPETDWGDAIEREMEGVGIELLHPTSFPRPRKNDALATPKSGKKSL